MFDESSLRQLLGAVAKGERSVEDALAALRGLPYEDVGGFACIDHHRAVRRGFPEVVYCREKTPDQVAAIVERLAERSPRVLGTRASPEHYEATRAVIPEVNYQETARTIWLDREPDRERSDGIVLVAAGTSDLPVIEEAALTLDLMGHGSHRICDVGVAGLHRLLGHLPVLQEASVIIVAAGMEGALPGVVGGLVSGVVIGVPTSVGYGANFGGVAALLTMLNSCASGVAVVNIDNGFGAACLAATINRSPTTRP